MTKAKTDDATPEPAIAPEVEEAAKADHYTGTYEGHPNGIVYRACKKCGQLAPGQDNPNGGLSHLKFGHLESCDYFKPEPPAVNPALLDAEAEKEEWAAAAKEAKAAAKGKGK